MKKENSKDKRPEGGEMRPEYDFSDGVRGKHYKKIRKGYSVTVHKADKTTFVQYFRPQEGMIILAPDVRKYFSNSGQVNKALRSLIKRIPQKATVGEKTGRVKKVG